MALYALLCFTVDSRFAVRLTPCASPNSYQSGHARRATYARARGGRRADAAVLFRRERVLELPHLLQPLAALRLALGHDVRHRGGRARQRTADPRGDRLAGEHHLLPADQREHGHEVPVLRRQAGGRGARVRGQSRGARVRRARAGAALLARLGRFGGRPVRLLGGEPGGAGRRPDHQHRGGRGALELPEDGGGLLQRGAADLLDGYVLAATPQP
eukprot:scaffold7757_cov39-Phaeocystis_antarctica.AAC.2